MLWVYVPESNHNYPSDRGVKIARWNGTAFRKQINADQMEGMLREAWDWSHFASHWAIVAAPEGPAEPE